MIMYSSGLSENEYENVYVREKGALRCVTSSSTLTSSYKLFDREFSVRLCMDRFPANACSKTNDHFIFTYNSEGSLRYTPRSLLDVSLLFIADNIEHVESLTGFPEQMADKLFAAAEAKQKFEAPSTSARGLQLFADAYGELVLKSLCLRERSLLLSERMEEIRVFRCLETLDLHGCGLGDGHEVFSHLTSEACSRLVTLFLGANRLSDEGLRRLTAPVRVMKRGLETLQHLDLSSNPVTEKGLRYLTCFSNLRELNLSHTNVQLDTRLKSFLSSKMFMVYSASALQTFTHSECKTEGWAAQVVNQWELNAAQVTQKIPRPRSNALQFYGIEKCVQVCVGSARNDCCLQENTSLIHFHKLDLHSVSDHSTDTQTHLNTPQTHTHLNTRRGGKRKLSGEQDVANSVKRSASLRPLSAEDLELLSKY